MPPASLTFWSWKWCPSHVWRGYLCANSSGLCVLDLGPMYATDRQTSDAHHRLMPPTLGAGHNNLHALFLSVRQSVCHTAFCVETIVHIIKLLYTFIFIHRYMVERFQCNIWSNTISLTKLGYSATIIVNIKILTILLTFLSQHNV